MVVGSSSGERLAVQGQESEILVAPRGVHLVSLGDEETRVMLSSVRKRSRFDELFTNLRVVRGLRILRGHFGRCCGS
jgi:hypothetical protein